MTRGRGAAELRKLGRRLKRWRERARLTLRDVSLGIGKSENYYGMIERGQRNPSEEVLEKICETLDVPEGERDEAFRLFATGRAREAAMQSLRNLSKRTQDLVIQHDVIEAVTAQTPTDRWLSEGIEELTRVFAAATDGQKALVIEDLRSRALMLEAGRVGTGGQRSVRRADRR